MMAAAITNAQAANGTGTANGADVLIVGGGLAGLTAAALLARRGLTPLVLEKSAELGGRARTGMEDGFFFNLGPRALYRHGPAWHILRELGIPFEGRRPRTAGDALCRGKRFVLPTGGRSLLRTRLLSVLEKMQFAQFLGRFPKIDPRALDAVTVDDWLAKEQLRPRVAELVRAFLRLSTYCADFDLESAGAAVEQLQLALSHGVEYLDGGWQTLVDGLRKSLTEGGVRIVTQARVERVIEADGTVDGVRLATGDEYHAPIVILACDPPTSVQLVEGRAKTELQRWQEAAVPVRAACLDVGLKALPRPRANFALGIDRPWYLSVHSATAQLAPPGAAMIHALRYYSASEAPEPKAVRHELEGVLDLVQPGWRDVLVCRRELPMMCVASAVVGAGQNGTANRPGPAVAGIRGLYVAGDWVGQQGMLTDASLASAKQAVEQIVTEHRKAPTAKTTARRSADFSSLASNL
jgi:phytoene dehydrogenase-like protein